MEYRRKVSYAANTACVLGGLVAGVSAYNGYYSITAPTGFISFISGMANIVNSIGKMEDDIREISIIEKNLEEKIAEVLNKK